MKITTILLFFILLGLFAAVIFLSLEYLNSPTNTGEGFKQIIINRGDRTAQIASKLKSDGLIRSELFFLFLLAYSKNLGKIKSGKFSLSPNFTTAQVIQKICSNNVITRKVVLPEGFTSLEIASEIDLNNFCTKKEFIDIVNSPELNNIQFPYPYQLPDRLEGFLFPDTYIFEDDIPCDNIVQKLVNHFFEVFDTSYINTAKQNGFSLTKIVTLASLVEKEAKLDIERGKIAGVLMNRLRHDIPLQCDATIQYVLPKRKARLLYEDLSINSFYNTYKYKGLPPGPICNPGLKSLKAAVYPANISAYYYVAKSDGSHIFTRTEQEHNFAKANAKRSWKKQ